MEARHRQTRRTPSSRKFFPVGYVASSHLPYSYEPMEEFWYEYMLTWDFFRPPFRSRVPLSVVVVVLQELGAGF